MVSLFGHFMSLPNCFLSEVPPHWCLSEVHQLFGDDLGDISRGSQKSQQITAS